MEEYIPKGRSFFFFFVSLIPVIIFITFATYKAMLSPQQYFGIFFLWLFPINGICNVDKICYVLGIVCEKLGNY